jgi:hypothetical protein
MHTHLFTLRGMTSAWGLRDITGMFLRYDRFMGETVGIFVYMYSLFILSQLSF